MRADGLTLLINLLSQAKTETVITQRLGESRQISATQYKAAYLDRLNRYCPEIPSFGMLYQVELSPGATRDSLRDILASALEDYTVNERIQVPLTMSGSAPGAGFHVHDFINKLVEISILSSPSEAADIFAASLSESRCEFRQFVLLGGVSIDKQVDVFDGIQILPMPTSSSQLPPWLPAVGFSDIPARAFLGGVVLAIDRYVSPRYRTPDTRIDVPEREILTTASNGAPDFDESVFCSCLSLACNTNVRQSVMWQHSSQMEIATMNDGGNNSFAYSIANRSGSTPISCREIRRAKDLYAAFERLEDSVKRRLEVPINRWISSLDNKSLVDQAIDLGIALEALYANDGGSEISFRLRIRAAKHLRERVENQNSVNEQVDRFYRLRSASVHEGKLPDRRLNVAGEAVEHAELLKMGRELCREAILKIVNEGRLPDWKGMALA